MTDTELNALEKAANIAKERSNEKDFFGMNSELVIFYAMTSPETILELVEELRQTRAERNWLAETLEVHSFMLELDAKNEIPRCSESEWLRRAKEATCQ